MPEVVPHVVEDGFDWAFWYYQPDYYVHLPDFEWAVGEIINAPAFRRSYKTVANLPGPRDTDFTIYKKRVSSE
jgi:hypothetical protein